jgi:hypothetical protein
MTQEPVILPSDHLNQIEAVLDALSDGYGINAPTEAEQGDYQEMFEELQEARP